MNESIAMNGMQLIFPPGWTPYSPYLALPQLKGFLNSHQLDAEIKDENITFFDTVFSAEFLLPKIRKAQSEFRLLNQKSSLSEEETERYKRLVQIELYSDHLSQIDELKKRLRTNPEKLSKPVYEEILRVFAVALEVLNLLYDQKIDFTHIEFNRYREDNSKQIEQAIADADHNVFLDYFLNNRSELIDQTQSYRFIGFSITSAAQLIPALTLIQLIRRMNKKSIIFLGGNYITRLTEQRENNLYFLFDYVDFISIYEGEYALELLLKSDITRETLHKKIETIPNLVYRKGQEILRTGYEKFKIEDVVCPNFAGFPLDKYFSPILVLPLMTSKNCYSHCAFCTIANGTGGRNYNVVSIPKVQKYMGDLMQKHNTKYFTFVDETFHMKRMVNLAKAILGDGKDYRWYGETRFDYPLSLEEGKLLYQSGCRKIQFGLESYNQRVLNLMKKNVDLNLIRPILDSCIKSGISVHLFIIIGFPTETADEVQNTLSFTDEILKEASETYGLTECSRGMSIFGLEKGSDVYSNPEKYGVIPLEDADNNIGLGFEYDITDGISKAESKKIFSNLLTKTYRDGNIVNIPISRLIGEETSLFFCEAVSEEYTYQRICKNKWIHLKHNVYKSEGNCFLYYNFENNFSVVFPNIPEKLSDLDKKILFAYGFLEGKPETGDLQIAINPFFQFSQSDETVITATDSLTGEIYELNSFTFEVIKSLDQINLDGIRKYYAENEILSFAEFDGLIETLTENRILILY